MPRRCRSSLRPVLFSMEGFAMPAMPLFISVSEAASLPNRCFIDVRSRVVHGWDALGAYSKGHIAGAHFLTFDRVFAREPVFELGRHPWPDRRTVAAHLLGALGPTGNAHHRVIFYDDGGMNFAARAALCARWAGFKNAQILDGGLSAWVRCGLPLNDGAPAAADHPAAERVNDFLRQTIAGAVPQILGKAVEVLDGIAISLEDIGILVYLMRHLGGTLQQEVVVAVYTSYQAAAQLRCVQRIHQHHLLALCQRGGRGKHHLKITFLILELGQQRPPKSDVVIALHIRHYAPACSLGRQLAGGIQIGGSKVMF